MVPLLGRFRHKSHRMGRCSTSHRQKTAHSVPKTEGFFTGVKELHNLARRSKEGGKTEQNRTIQDLWDAPTKDRLDPSSNIAGGNLVEPYPQRV